MRRLADSVRCGEGGSMPARSIQDGLLALEFPRARLRDLDDACLVLVELRYLYELQVIFTRTEWYDPDDYAVVRRSVRSRLYEEDQLAVLHLSYGSSFIVDLAVNHWDDLGVAAGL